MGYIFSMQYEIETTEIFDKWLQKLKDRQAVLAIAKRLGRARLGNLGDVAPVGDGVQRDAVLSGSWLPPLLCDPGRQDYYHAVRR